MLQCVVVTRARCVAVCCSDSYSCCKTRILLSRVLDSSKQSFSCPRLFYRIVIIFGSLLQSLETASSTSWRLIVECILKVSTSYAVVLQCVAVCCSVLQFVAVCCSVLQCAAVCCSGLQCVAVCCSVYSQGLKKLPELGTERVSYSTKRQRTKESLPFLTTWPSTRLMLCPEIDKTIAHVRAR